GCRRRFFEGSRDTLPIPPLGVLHDKTAAADTKVFDPACVLRQSWGSTTEREGITMFARIGLVAILTLPAFLAQGAEPPKSWIDPDTGHQVVRLTEEPNSASLYFNQNGYTADGRKMVYTTPEGFSAFDLETRTGRSVVKGRVQVIVTGHKTPNVYYRKGDEIYSTNVDTLETRRIGKLPVRGAVATVNADETLLAGTYIEGDGQDFAGRNPAPGQAAPTAQAQTASQIHPLEQALNKGQMMEQRLAAPLPMAMFTMNAAT